MKQAYPTRTQEDDPLYQRVDSQILTLVDEDPDYRQQEDIGEKARTNGAFVSITRHTDIGSGE